MQRQYVFYKLSKHKVEKNYNFIMDWKASRLFPGLKKKVNLGYLIYFKIKCILTPD